MENVEAKELLDAYKYKVLGALPYSTNLVDLLGANENAHTRVLTTILRYRRDGECPFLRSFLERAQVSDAVLDELPELRVETQKLYIDALIRGTKTAVIIENKINWACDQHEQIARYIGEVKGMVPQEGISVIYLTDNGDKKASDDSLTPEAKAALGCKDGDDGRFIEMNYKDDILPWLKEQVLNNCRYADRMLVAALEQYIDWLERRFGLVANPKQTLFEKFFEERQGQGCTAKDRYECLMRWQDFLSDRNLSEDDVAIDFRQQVINARIRMVRADYGLDSDFAFPLKFYFVYGWARKNQFSAKRWKPGGSICFERKVQAVKICVNICMYHDKDDVDCVLVAGAGLEGDLLGPLYHRYQEIFELWDEVIRDTNQEGEIVAVRRRLHGCNSEEELEKVLDDKVKMFLEIFWGAQEDWCKYA